MASPHRAGGWLSRAHRLLAEDGDPACAEQGLLLIPAGLHLLFSGDGEAAVEVFEQAAEIGRRFRDPDVIAFGVLGSGQAMVARGHRDAGMALLDEAMVAVTAEDVSPITLGIAYCAVIETCHLAFDLHRAREWTGELTRWCAAQPDLVPYRGQCLVHRAQVLALEGHWSEAMEEMRRARERSGGSARGSPPSAWPGTRRESCYAAWADTVTPRTAIARPASTVIRRSRGCSCYAWRRDAGRMLGASVDSALATVHSRGERWHLLAAASEVCCACGDTAAARAAADELDDVAREQTGEWLRAIAATAVGSVLLAEGTPRDAGAVLRHAFEAWRELHVPYEAARVRLLLGEVRHALGDTDGALLEWDAARYTFDELGAADDLAHVEARLSPEPPARPSGLTEREVEVLRLVGRAAPTARSRTRSCSASTPSAGTCRTCSAASGSPRGRPPPRSRCSTI